MKHLMMTIVLMLVAIGTSAQNTQKLNERYFQAKVREMVIRLNMTDEQRERFVPVYRRYSNEMRNTVGVRKPSAAPKTDEERLKLTKLKIKRQQEAQAIRMKYVDIFATILNAQQVNKFFEVENDIQQKLKRKQHAGYASPHRR